MNLFKFCYFLATGFGLGNRFDIMPVGTVASLIAIPIWWCLVYFFSYQIYCFFLVLGIIIGVYVCEKVNNYIGIHDHQSIVWDEFIGMWITLMVVPVSNFIWAVVAFLLFRLFDIVKPWPISWCDRVIQGGFGIMIDDILSGLISVCIIFYLYKI